MQYFLSKQFEKNFTKLPKKTKQKALEQLKLFATDPMSTQLNNHALAGKWTNHRSINITGDIRAVYCIVEKGLVRFVDIGSHAKLYK